MDDFDIAKKCLDTISKKGDLFDTIAEKEGVKPSKIPFLRLNASLLSRILYVGVLIYEKIKSHFSPVREVRDAQNQIRQILGVNVDIIRSKTPPSLNRLIFLNNIIDSDSVIEEEPLLAILYENRLCDAEEYINHLQKILSFCSLHDIKRIYLNIDDIMYLFTDIDLLSDITANIFDTSDKQMLFKNDETTDDLGLLALNVSDLSLLIKKLEKYKFNKNFIIELGEQIEDLLVKNAIQEFMKNGGLDKLKTIVLGRLAMYLNSDSSSRDKIYGKVYETISINSEYVKVLTSDTNGKIISNTVMTLYDYLEIPNYQSLLEQIKKKSDNKEILLISALYLHLCHDKKVKSEQTKSSESFFDKIYLQFRDKQISKKKRKIDELYSKSYKTKRNLLDMFLSFLLDILIVSVILVTGVSIDTFIFKNNDSDIFKKIGNILESIIYPYKCSFELEKQILTDIGKQLDLDEFLEKQIKTKNTTEDVQIEEENEISNFYNVTNSYTGDSPNNSRNEIIGYVIPLNDFYERPKYFATGYGTSATYDDGMISYTIKTPQLSFKEMENVEPLFDVSYEISQEDLKNAINGYEINLSQSLYPVGANYVLMELYIVDLRQGLEFSVGSNRISITGNVISEKEKELLNSMKHPVIHYRYGISSDVENSFAMKLDKESSYTSIPSSEIKDAIISGLELNENASIEEILSAIKNKTYSKTPIKDAGLTRKVKKMDELKYYETVASLDSLICNLAATLAVEADEELVYITGYMDNQDGVITYDERHAWAMRNNGEIVDVTPTTLSNNEEDKDSLLQKDIDIILDWALENKIPICSIMVLVGIMSKRKYRRKIILTLKIAKAKKVLNAKDRDESYAKIQEFMYGGIHIPKKSTQSEFVEKVTNEFAAFNKEELKEIKRQLKMSKRENKDIPNTAIKMTDQISFIKEHNSDLQRILTKKEKH